MPLVAVGKRMTMAGDPPMFGMPNEGVVPNAVWALVVGSAYCRLPSVPPAVWTRLLLLKSHWPTLCARTLETRKSGKQNMSVAARFFVVGFIWFWGCCLTLVMCDMKVYSKRLLGRSSAYRFLF